jgi:hypothetical protein
MREGLGHDNLHHADHQDQYELLYRHFEAKKQQWEENKGKKEKGPRTSRGM